MKYLNQYILLGLLCMIPLIGCDTDELTDLNINPTAANELDWRFIFTTGQVQTAENRYINGRVHLNLASGLIQQTATMQVGGERGSGDKYFRHLDSFNGFQLYYTRGALKSLAEVIRQTGPDGVNPSWTNLHHMAQVQYAYVMHLMTDLHGNIPYSEANKGIEGIFFPKYDSQQSIYMDLLAKLEAAANAIGSGPDEVGAADIIYQGDFAKWKKLANSLMLRLAMRISNVDPSTAQSFVQKAISGGVMEDNSDMAWIPMASGPSQWFNQNGISRAMIPDDWGANNMLGKTLVDWLQERNDPRLRIWAVRGIWGGPYLTDPADQVGMPNGYDSETMKEYLGKESVDRELDFSRINPALLDTDDPWIMMTAAEVQFLLSEAAVKGWHTGDATEHYNKGVRLSMQQWTPFDESFVVTDEEVDAYLAANPFDGSSLEMIGEQHWAANFMQWYEAYSNWRRTGYPVLTPVDYLGNVSGGQIFRRIEYNQGEVANNPNFLEGSTQPDDVMTRMWWDVN